MPPAEDNKQKHKIKTFRERQPTHKALDNVTTKHHTFIKKRGKERLHSTNQKWKLDVEEPGQEMEKVQV